MPDPVPATPPRRVRGHVALAATLAAALTLPALLGAQGVPVPTDTLRLPGLRAPVEVVRDRSGINHITAQDEHDLFFAQGYAAARDRLFQLELWRRQATGTVAALLGPREVERDRGSRLFLFRGDMEQELAHYHPRGAAIIGAFVSGINARVAEVRRDTAQLPLELELLGALPEPWTPAVVISRHQGLLGNVQQELTYGRAVAAAGAEAVRRVSSFGPDEPVLALDPAIRGELLSADILAPYRAFRAPLRFQAGDLAPAHRGDTLALRGLTEAAAALDRAEPPDDDEVETRRWRERHDVGSNNWVVSGARTASGRPIMANDPHRAVALPSLRYWVHLQAPGWNVVGGGEPAIPGVSIGHNEHGAWGLTIFNTDMEDLLVYETNPARPDEYRYRGAWERMRVVHDTIPVKGAAPTVVTLSYTRHGPVVHEDTANRVAYAVRAAWLDVGAAPYLGSLRMDQARTWAEFREASRWSHLPAENMVWVDTAGTIGWQVVGIAPVRRHWSGLVPVPGDGRYEWDGYLPMLERPGAVDPASGWIATANNDVVPPGYPHRAAIGYSWADPYRWQRIAEVLDTTRAATASSMARLQTDYLSIPARTLVPLLGDVRIADLRVDSARARLLAWDHVLAPESVPAGIHAAWLRRLTAAVDSIMIPPALRAHVRSVSLSRAIAWLHDPPPEFGADPSAARDTLVARALAAAVADLTARLGPDMAGWRYGQPAYKHARLEHPLGALLPDSLRARLDVGPLPRGGDAHTVGAAGGADRQAHGATFRLVVDVADWDGALGTSAPGQSGDPASPHYRDLFERWAGDAFFPVPYSRAAVEAAAVGRTVLVP